MHIILLFITLTNVPLGMTYLIEGPSNASYPIGKDIELTCHFSDGPGAIAWQEGDTIIFYNKDKNTVKDKYNNFRVNVEGGTSTMFILSADVDDEGSYICAQLDDRATALVRIEDPPILYMRFLGNKVEGTTLPDPSNYIISIKCLAEGAHPAVSINFTIDDGVFLEPTSQEIDQQDSLFDTTATLEYTFPENQNHSLVTCQSYGQVLYEAINISQELEKPTCTLIVNNDEAICTCNASPDVYKYVLLINEEIDLLTNHVKLKDYPQSSIICFGVNYIGIGQSQLIQIPLIINNGRTINFVPIVTICIFLVGVGIAIWLIIRWKKTHKSGRSENIHQHMNIDPEQQSEPICCRAMVTHIREKRVKTFITEFHDGIIQDTTLLNDIELFFVKVLHLEADRVRDIMKDHKEPEVQVNIALDEWVKQSGKNVTIDTLRKKITSSEDTYKAYGMDKHSAITRIKPEEHINPPKTEEEIPLTNVQSDQAEHDYGDQHRRGFRLMMYECGSRIGKNSLHQLLRDEYAFIKEEIPQLHATNIDTSKAPGIYLTELLVNKETVKDEKGSLSTFFLQLKNMYLYRAEMIVGNYIEGISAELKSYIDIVVDQVNQDWEIFAIEVLHLKIVEVKKLQDTKTDNFVEPLKAAMRLWEDSKNGNATKGMLIREIEKNKDFSTKCQLNKDTHSDITKDHENTEPVNSKDRDQVIRNGSESKFFQTLYNCGKLIGTVGAIRLSSRCSSFSKKEISQATSVDVLQVMVDKGDIVDSNKSLEEFSKYLEDTYQFRAKCVVDQYLKDLRDDLQDHINELSCQLNRDWEIFAIEVLSIDIDKVQELANSRDNIPDHVAGIFSIWQYDKEGLATKELLVRLITSSNNFAKIIPPTGVQTTLDKTHKGKTSSRDTTKIPPALTDKQGRKSWNTLLTRCGQYIGHVGARKLADHFDSQTFDEVPSNLKDGCGALKCLIQEKKIEDNMSSMQVLGKTLEACHLFLAKRIVGDYMGESDLIQYIGDLVDKIDLDWELLAIYILNITLEQVRQIIRETDDVKEQVWNAFSIWIFNKGGSASKDMLDATIKIKSEMFESITSQTTQPQFSQINDCLSTLDQPSFVDMMKDCGHLIGNTGLQRLSIFVLKKEDESTSIKTWGELITYLIEKRNLKNTTEFKGYLCYELQKARLFRARNIVISHIEKEEKYLISNIADKKAPQWEKFASKYLELSIKDLNSVKMNTTSNKDRVQAALSLWLRKANIDSDVLSALKDMNSSCA